MEQVSTAVPVIPDNAPRPVIEMIEAILANQDGLMVFESRRGLLYIDYAPGDVRLRIDKLSLKPVEERTGMLDS